MIVQRADRLTAFGEIYERARKPLATWLRTAENATWKSIVDVRQMYPQADGVSVESGATVTVFNISGNKYRLIVKIDYEFEFIEVADVLTHAEYSRGRWKRRL